MSYNFKLTQQASDDLDEIVRYMAMELVNKKAARDFLVTSRERYRKPVCFQRVAFWLKTIFFPI